MANFNGRPPIKLLESDVLRAMEHTLSNAAAARFLGVSKKTYKKYALLYLDKTGANEKRVTDYTAPLLLHQEAGDKTNFSLDNLKVYCYNCYYLYVGSITYRVNNEKVKNKDIEDQIDDDMYDYLRTL